MLIVLGGLPGVGKTTIARELALRLHAVHIRIDSIEQALRPAITDMDDWGYHAAYAVAEDNLRVGRTVIADSVNPIRVTRAAWRDAGRRAGVRVIEVEVICSDPAQHRHRVETRTPDIAGLGLPMWADVLERGYEPWPEAEIVVDTFVQTLEQIAAELERVAGRT